MYVTAEFIRGWLVVLVVYWTSVYVGVIIFIHSEFDWSRGLLVILARLIVCDRMRGRGGSVGGSEGAAI